MKLIQALILTTTVSCVGGAWAQNVTVSDAWVRATVTGQKATGAFMTFKAKTSTQLVGVSSPAAGVAQVHEMKMEGDVMRMAALTRGLDLPAGKAVALKPGGYHLMLMDLKTPLTQDAAVPVTLTFRDAKGATFTQALKLPVLSQAPGTAAAAPAIHDQHDGHDHKGHNHGKH